MNNHTKPFACGRCLACETSNCQSCESPRGGCRCEECVGPSKPTEVDALRALVGQRCDGIECDHARERDGCVEEMRWLKLSLAQHDAKLDAIRAERDTLKAALGRIAGVEVRVGDALSAPGRYLKACRDCAREALGEVES